MKRAALYARAAAGIPTVEDQLRELRDAAGRCSWQVVGEFIEPGSSSGAGGGGRGRGEGPAPDRLMAAVARREVDLVAACSLDRLGRSLPELVARLCELRSRGVDLYLHRPGLDTCTPAGQALYELLDLFGDCERSLVVEGVLAGGAAEPWTVRGVSPETREAVREAAAGESLPVGAWMDRVLWQAAQAALKPSPPPATAEDVERIVRRLLDERIEPPSR